MISKIGSGPHEMKSETKRIAERNKTNAFFMPCISYKNAKIAGLGHEQAVLNHIINPILRR
jgi:hypothetical protein